MGIDEYGRLPVSRSVIWLGVAAAVVIAFAGACQSAPATHPSAVAPAPAHAGPAGDGPSVSAAMICQPEATGEIAIALGAPTSKQPVGTWQAQDHEYSCRFDYATGFMVLSVKEMSDVAATDAYFTAAQKGLPSTTPLKVLGQTAFEGPDGSLYVRKDFKVLHVDVAGLPDHFGQQSITRADVAFRAAAAVMSCWTGA
jgi:hypothetical protein